MTYKFTEKDVIVQGAYDLGATLTLPETSSEKLPAIVIIGGTGKGDRNGNMKNFNMNIYRQLAEFLTGLGFVTIRYDKRGVGQSQGDHLKTGVSDLIEDIMSIIRYLESLPQVDSQRILLCGHSEGAILSTLVSKQYPVAGLILLSGAGVSLKTAMHYQNLAVCEEIDGMKGIKGKLLGLLATEEKILAKERQLFSAVQNTEEDVIRIQLQKFPAKWLREHLTYTDEEVQNILQNTTCPVIAITGDKDVQADPRDLDELAAFQKHTITCSVIKNMDHVLREFFGEKSVLNVKKQYKQELNMPLHSGLKEELQAWFQKIF